jgi:hypothetical protein
MAFENRKTSVGSADSEQISQHLRFYWFDRSVGYICKTDLKMLSSDEQMEGMAVMPMDSYSEEEWTATGRTNQFWFSSVF